MERKVVEEFKLSDGRTVKIYEGIGEDFLTAIEIAEATGKTSVKDTVLTLMELLIEVDGQKLPAEEFAKLPLKDFMKLYNKIGENLS